MLRATHLLHVAWPLWGSRKAFTPPSIAGLRWWADGASAHSDGSGGADSWTDKGPLGFNLNVVSATHPTLLAADANGKPAVQFVEASSTSLKRASVALLTGQAYTYFFAIKLDALVTTRVPFSWTDAGGGTGIQVRVQATAWNVSQPAVYNASGGTPSTTGYHVIEVNRAAGAAPTFKIDGAATALTGATTADYLVGTDDLALGAQFGTGLFQSCRIAEGFVYDSSLSAGNASAARAYLGARYGIAVT